MAFNNPNQMNQFRGMHPGMGGKPQMMIRKPKPVQNQPGGKLMRLKCRFRPLQDTYISNGEINEKDSDVTFVCSDGSIGAHKIILASSSMLFIKLFGDQQSGDITTVVVPDISTEIMRIVLTLTYSDKITITPQQMKEVGPFMNLFGMSWSKFRCNDSQNQEVSTPSDVKPIESQGIPSQSQQQLHQQQVAQLQRPPQYQQQQGHPRLQQQLSQGQILRKSETSLPMARGNLRMDGPPPLRKMKIIHSNHEGNMGESGNDQGQGREFKFHVQGYSGGQVQPGPNRASGSQQGQIQIRPLKQLLAGGSGWQQDQGQGQAKKIIYLGNQNSGEGMRGYRRIAPKPMSQPQSEGEMDLYGGVSDQLEIQMDTEDSTEEDNLTVDPESGRIMIQEWVKNLGRDSASQKKPTPVGNKAVTAGHSRSNPTAQQALAAGHQCTICNNVFDDESKWHWHETHHVGLGIYKCEYCDELFSTSRKVYQHEMMEHGVTTNNGPAEPPTIPEDFQIVNGRKRKMSPAEGENDTYESQQGSNPTRMTLVRTLHGSHYRKLPTAAGASMKRKIALSKMSRMNLAKNFRSRNPLIGIGHVEEEGGEDTRKIKQLHWIYVCSKCEHGVDSSQKALAHFKKCYQDGDIAFEQSVIKYRQGFFGKVKCPICPRRYTSAGGFKIHCGHMHTDYRKKFLHNSNDDTISCINCRKKYKDPVDFHYHLSDGECYDAPEFNADDAESRWMGNGNPGEGDDSNSPPKLKKERNSAPAAASGSSVTPTAPPAPHSSSSLSRSTRLTKRILMNSEDGGEGESKFKPVSCPACGTQSVDKIVEHLQKQHPELDLLVSRVGDGLLRCQKCRITFTLSDLMVHIEGCEGSKLFQYVSERKTSNTGSKARLSGLTSEGTPLVLPPGIGCSPIDKIECEDLASVETLKAAMTCGVCGKQGKKLGVIAECLKSHGIIRCALCFNTYKDRVSYSSHLKQAHGGPPGRYICPLCPKTFINAGQVAGHMYNHHWMMVTVKDPAAKAKGKGNLDKDEGIAEMDQDILAAVGLTANPGAVRDRDDYSNITLGSILSSSDNSAKELGLDEKGESAEDGSDGLQETDKLQETEADDNQDELKIDEDVAK